MNIVRFIRSRFRQSPAAFAVACAILFAALCLAIPSYFPLMEPDSYGYVDFAPSRTAIYPLFLRALMGLGLSLDQITYVQVTVFCGALTVLIAAPLPGWLFSSFAAENAEKCCSGCFLVLARSRQRRSFIMIPGCGSCA